MINFIKQIFTWWNRQTFGTFIYTILKGKFVGKDNLGNKYYKNSQDKRWVIYKSDVESTKIPPNWFLWIHFMTDKIPSDKDDLAYDWQKSHQENLTGTDKAYRPKGSLGSKNLVEKKLYERWKS